MWLEGDEVSGIYLNFEKKVFFENQSLGVVLYSKYDGREVYNLGFVKVLNWELGDVGFSIFVLFFEYFGSFWLVIV